MFVLEYGENVYCHAVPINTSAVMPLYHSALHFITNDNLSVYQSVGWVFLQKRRNSYLLQFIYIKSLTIEATRLPQISYLI